MTRPQLRPYQQEVQDRIFEHWRNGTRNVMAVMPCGAGKCLGRGTPVLMFDGSIKMVEDIQVADALMGPDSQPRWVIGTTTGFDQLYRVVPVKGDSYVINSQHILSLKPTGADRNPSTKGKVVNVAVTDYLGSSSNFKHMHKGWRTGVDFPPNNADLKIDPYWLGIWLGDGTTLLPSITTMDHEVVSYCYEYAAKLGLNIRVETKKDNNKAFTLHFTTNTKGRPNPLTDMMRSYGLLGRKHIPAGYKTASREVRMAVLTGILDSDGYYDGKGYDLTLKQEELMDDFLFIARSLGFAAYKVPVRKTATNTGTTGDYFRCNLNGHLDQIPCRVARRKANPRNQIKNHLVTGITVEPIGLGEFFGFQVMGGADQLFMLGDFTVTHNSVLASDTVRKFHEQRSSALIMAHRRELTTQLSLHLGRQEIPHRILGPKDVVSNTISEHRRELGGRCFVNPSASIACGGVDTIVARLPELSEWLSRVDLLVGDEGHHNQKNNIWGKVHAACYRSFSLLMSATPQRADGGGIGRGNIIKPAVFDSRGKLITPAEYDGDGVTDALVIGPSPRQLIEMGNLTDYEYVLPISDFDLNSLKQGDSGDYTTPSMKAASEKSSITGDVVENYVKFAAGKRAVVFATDVETAAKMAANFNSAGIPAAMVSGKTDGAVRDDAIRRLRDGRLLVLTSVDILGEGFDLPALDVVIMARPTASLAVYIQQAMRCLRPAPGKKLGLIIDHVKNVVRHRWPDADRAWTLDRRGKRAAKAKDPDEVAIMVCPETGKPYEAHEAANCPRCGGNHTKPTGEGITRAIEIIAGDLTKLSAADLAALRAATVLPTPDEVVDPRWSEGVQIGQRNIALARIQAQRELSDALADWGGVQRHKHGRDDSELHRRFYHATGVDVLTALAGSRAEMVALTERIRGWME